MLLGNGQRVRRCWHKWALYTSSAMGHSAHEIIRGELGAAQSLVESQALSHMTAEAMRAVLSQMCEIGAAFVRSGWCRWCSHTVERRLAALAQTHSAELNLAHQARDEAQSAAVTCALSSVAAFLTRTSARQKHRAFCVWLRVVAAAHKATLVESLSHARRCAAACRVAAVMTRATHSLVRRSWRVWHRLVVDAHALSHTASLEEDNERALKFATARAVALGVLNRAHAIATVSASADRLRVLQRGLHTWATVVALSKQAEGQSREAQMAGQLRQNQLTHVARAARCTHGLLARARDRATERAWRKLTATVAQHQRAALQEALSSATSRATSLADVAEGRRWDLLQFFRSEAARAMRILWARSDGRRVRVAFLRWVRGTAHVTLTREMSRVEEARGMLRSSCAARALMVRLQEHRARAAQLQLQAWHTWKRALVRIAHCADLRHAVATGNKQSALCVAAWRIIGQSTTAVRQRAVSRGFQAFVKAVREGREREVHAQLRVDQRAELDSRLEAHEAQHEARLREQQQQHAYEALEVMKGRRISESSRSIGAMLALSACRRVHRAWSKWSIRLFGARAALAKNWAVDRALAHAAELAETSRRESEKSAERARLGTVLGAKQQHAERARTLVEASARLVFSLLSRTARQRAQRFLWRWRCETSRDHTSRLMIAHGNELKRARRSQAVRSMSALFEAACGPRVQLEKALRSWLLAVVTVAASASVATVESRAEQAESQSQAAQKELAHANARQRLGVGVSCANMLVFSASIRSKQRAWRKLRAVVTSFTQGVLQESLDRALETSAALSSLAETRASELGRVQREGSARVIFSLITRSGSRKMRRALLAWGREIVQTSTSQIRCLENSCADARAATEAADMALQFAVREAQRSASALQVEMARVDALERQRAATRVQLERKDNTLRLRDEQLVSLQREHETVLAQAGGLGGLGLGQPESLTQPSQPSQLPQSQPSQDRLESQRSAGDNNSESDGLGLTRGLSDDPTLGTLGSPNHGLQRALNAHAALESSFSDSFSDVEDATSSERDGEHSGDEATADEIGNGLEVGSRRTPHPSQPTTHTTENTTAETTATTRPTIEELLNDIDGLIARNHTDIISAEQQQQIALVQDADDADADAAEGTEASPVKPSAPPRAIGPTRLPLPKLRRDHVRYTSA